MKTPNTARRRPTAALAVLAGVVAITVGASQAWAGIPNTTTGVISGCYNSTGTLRVIDAQQGATCAAGETPLSWNATAITATRWSSVWGITRPLTRAPNVPEVVLQKPGSRLPAGSWMVTASVLMTNSQEMSTFRCSTRTRGTLIQAGFQQQDWAGVDGWHHTMVIPGMVTMTEPDWIDVVCSHDQALSPGGFVEVHFAEVIVQRIAATF